MENARRPRFLRLGGLELAARLGAGVVLVLALQSHWRAETPVMVWALCGVALAFMVRRTRVTVDTERRELRVPAGWLGWNRRVVPAAELTMVCVPAATRSMVSVVFVGPQRIVRTPLLRHEVATAQAARAATVLQLAYQEGERVLEGGFADESLRERLHRTGAAPGERTIEHDSPFRDARQVLHAPTAPAGSRVVVTEKEGELRMRVPVDGRMVQVGLGGMALSTLAAVMGGQQLGSIHEVVAGEVMGIGLVLIVPFILVTLWGMRRGFELRVDGRTLTVRRPSWLPYSVPLTQLSDVFAVDALDERFGYARHNATGRLVVRRTDGTFKTFGAGQSLSELRWVAERTKFQLAA